MDVILWFDSRSKTPGLGIYKQGHDLDCWLIDHAANTPHMIYFEAHLEITT